MSDKRKSWSHIKELRIQMELIQNQVAEELNITSRYISNVENNLMHKISKMSTDKKLKLLKTLDLWEE